MLNSRGRTHETQRTARGALYRALAVASLGSALVVLTPGCIAVVAGTGAGAVVAYSRGRLDTILSADLGRTEKAADAAIAQLQFAKISEKSDALESVFIARTAMDTKVRIELSKEGEQVTRVIIRVGIFGNESVSLAILDKIKANLGV